ncbi:MAG TPA: cytochrome c biogenesis protein CcdA [Ignavibacteriaceae bacterium]|nr:cytochrome c biogenesis protein CcdA [Ignavibacteriaceae bacterium]
MKKNKCFPAVMMLIFLVSCSFTFAQPVGGKQVIHIKSYQSFDKVYPGSEFGIAVKVNVDSGWHINSDKPNEDFLIPSQIVIDTTVFKLTRIAYPKPHDLKLEISDIPLSVWESEVYIGVLVKAPQNLTSGKYKLPINIDYQACNNMTCMPPNNIRDTLEIEIANKQAAVNQINSDIFDRINLQPTVEKSVVKNGSDNSISSILEGNGLLIGLFFVFLGGLALNLTPCVYPLIPITIGFFGGQSEGKTSRLVGMGLLFVVGMAVTYSLIGVITALTGSVFGALLQNPIVIVLIALIFIVLSLSMFGVYEFKLPDSWVAKAGGAKGGMYGAFFMGLTMGIVAAPCIGPFVLGLVTYVAAKADPFFGFLLFFILAVGLGTPYLFLAIFSGKIKNLPRAGEWMEAVKHIFGLILIGMAIYFLLPLLPKSFSSFLLPGFMIIAAVYLLFFDKNANNVRGFRIFKVVFSIVLLVVAVYWLIPSEKQSIEWHPYNEAAVTNTSKATIIDFYADWCIPCKELDAVTFSDPKVIEVSKKFNAYKADMTKSLSDQVETLRNKYNIVGVPTVLVINSKGEEVKRITGFVNSDEFLQIIQSVD